MHNLLRLSMERKRCVVARNVTHSCDTDVRAVP